MSEWHELAHFLYGREFWYADPIREIEGLAEEQLFWTPDPKSLCLLWHVGHIAHRERTHLGCFLQGVSENLIPARYEVFGPDWCAAEEVRRSIDSVTGVLTWVRETRAQSHAYLDALPEEAWHTVPAGSAFGLTAAQWIFLTAVHTAMHLGRLQLLRALLEGEHDRPC
jgi:hypothetical protein